MDLTEKAREIFSQDRYATECTGITIEQVGDHEALCSIAVDARHRNARGVVMGGALFTLADFAAAVAANSGNEGQELHWVSLDATIHYLSPAMGTRLTAHSKPLKVGRSTALYQTEITSLDNGNHMVAIVETTMVFV